MQKSEFWTLCSSNGIVLDLEQLASFERFAKEFIYWNEKVNMVSRKDTENIWDRHILHSLAIAKYIDIPDKARCMDIGTGGGFPGIPLKIAHPEIKMLLVDSIQKKVKIADMLGKHTGLKHIEGLCTRVEKLLDDKKYLQSFHFIFARAVAPVSKLIGWTDGLLRPDGQYIFLKGGDLTEELAAAQETFPHYNYETIDIKMIGYDFFEKEEKKIIKITRK